MFLITGTTISSHPSNRITAVCNCFLGFNYPFISPYTFTLTPPLTPKVASRCLGYLHWHDPSLEYDYCPQKITHYTRLHLPSLNPKRSHPDVLQLQKFILSTTQNVKHPKRRAFCF